MKLTTIIYLHASVNRKALGARNSVFWLNFQEFLDYIQTVTYVMHYLALHHWRSFCTNWTTFGEVFHEKPPKIGPNDCYANF